MSSDALLSFNKLLYIQFLRGCYHKLKCTFKKLCTFNSYGNVIISSNALLTNYCTFTTIFLPLPPFLRGCYHKLKFTFNRLLHILSGCYHKFKCIFNKLLYIQFLIGCLPFSIAKLNNL